VEITVEGDELEFSGGRSYHTLTCLYGGRAGVVELKPAELRVALAHRDLGKLLHQAHLKRCAEIVRVHQLTSGALNGLGNLGMTMPQSGDVDA
jgi:hypothetical protein